MQVSGLWRHPVKSLGGEPVTRTIVAATGVLGDRVWGVRDVASGAILSAKREPLLLQARAYASGEGIGVEIPDLGAATGSEVPRLLSRWLDREVVVDRAPESPYVDLAHLHLLTRAELGGWDVRRFRPNAVVDGVDSLDDLAGERLRLGSVVVEVTKRTKRCAMPTMNQCAGHGEALPKDVGVLRELARHRALRLGVYAQVVVPGVLTVGAPVALA